MGRCGRMDGPRRISAGNQEVTFDLRSWTTNSLSLQRLICCIYSEKTNETGRLCCRTLPGKYVDKIADQMRKNNINALLIVGGFEVRPTN